MEEQRFWELVEKTSGGGTSSLSGELGQLDDADLRGFADTLQAVQQRAYRWDLWAAGYLALGGLGDDSFQDFRTWLIRQGRSVFERVLADPDSLVELSWDEDEEDFAEAERWAYEVVEEWDRRHSEPLELSGAIDDGEPVGEPFPEDDPAWNAEHFPRLAARYQ